MIKIVLILFGLFSSTLFAQQLTQKEILLDENGKTITEEEFISKINSRDYKYTYFRTQTLKDSIIQNRLVLRNDYGRIKEADRLAVINALEEITGSEITHGQTVLINFYFSDTGHNTAAIVKHDSSERKIKRFIKKNKQYAHFFVTERGSFYNYENVYEDKFDKIKNMLFIVPSTTSYIIIRPNGSYYKHLGEYRQDDIPEILEAEW